MTYPLRIVSSQPNFRTYIKTVKKLSILSCIFSNSITNEYRGGAINIEESEYVSITNSIFINCSATDFGGSFSIISDVCEVHKVCCEFCWISRVADFHNGCAGFLTGNNQASHTLSSVYNCAPEFVKSYGYCVFAFHNSKVTKTKDVNASHCKQHGYIISNSDDSEVTHSTFDELQTICLYLHELSSISCQYCNILRQKSENDLSFKNRGSLFGQALFKKLTVNNVVFFDNNIDISFQGNYGFILYNCVTDKNSYPCETVNCSTGILECKTFKVSNAEGCYIPFSIGQMSNAPFKNYAFLFSFPILLLLIK